MIITGKTSSGFEYKLDDRQRSDVKVLKILSTMLRDDANEFEKLVATSDLPVAVLGKAQAEALEEHIREQNEGFCTNDDLTDAVMEIFKGNNDLKNL